MSDEDERDDDERDEDGDDAEGDSSDDDSGGGSSSDDSSGGSDGGASDDSSAEASGSSDGDAAVSSASASATPAKAAKGQRLSAGARLAAAKAAKAATKAAKKQARREEAGAATQTAAEREAEDRARDESAEEMLKESPLGRAATRAGEWTQANRQLTLGVLGIAAVAVLGWLGWSYYTTSQAAGAGALLAEAMRISSAEIVAADDEPDEGSDDDAPTFETVDARNEAALTAYRAVSAQYPGSPAAAWARLGEGRTLLAEREYSDARDAYQSAFDTSGDESVVAWQALEGIGATYEAEQDWEHATSTYERLASLADHAYENVANYHLARMRAASGDDAAALTAFRELVDTLREESDDEGHEPPFPYVLAQADQRLRELDPSAAGAGPSLGAGPTGEGGGIDSLTPEQIQELIQRLQTKGGGTGGAPQPE